jgi:hypothetical protein
LSTWLLSFASFFFVAATDGLGVASALGTGASRVAVTARAARPAERREYEVATGELLVGGIRRVGCAFCEAGGTDALTECRRS